MAVKKLRLYLLYAQEYWIFAVLMTGISYYAYTTAGLIAVTGLIWFKILTSILGIFYHQKKKHQQIFFYMNNGLGKKQLMLVAISLDIIVWVLGLIILLKTA